MQTTEISLVMGTKRYCPNEWWNPWRNSRLFQQIPVELIQFRENWRFFRKQVSSSYLRINLLILAETLQQQAGIFSILLRSVDAWKRYNENHLPGKQLLAHLTGATILTGVCKKEPIFIPCPLYSSVLNLQWYSALS